MKWMNQGMVLVGFMLWASVFSLPAASQSDAALAASMHVQESNFRILTGGNPIELNGMRPIASFDFGGRFDQVVVNAELDLRLSTSPVLNGAKAQLLIYVNNELAQALRLAPQTEDSSSQRRRVKLPAHLFANYNQVRFELIDGEVYEQCASGSFASWVAIDSRSTLSVTTEQLPYANELAYFPEPWFHASDFNAASFAMMLPTAASPTTLQAGAIVSSYFAALADWREVELSAHRYSRDTLYLPVPADDMTAEAELDLREWPAAHTLLLMTGNDWPTGLVAANAETIADLPTLESPQLIALNNPRYPAYKVLVIRAQTDAELVAASQALATVKTGFSGAYAVVRPQSLPVAAPYQAPNWISTERPVAFRELVDNEQALQREGYLPAPIRVSLRLPPDLFTWQADEIPLDLKYRFTPATTSIENQLTVRVNDLFVKAFRLDDEEVIQSQRRMRIPLVDSGLFADNMVSIPAFKMGLINELQFAFEFAQPTSCAVKPLANSIGAIDGDSQIDLTGYSHYVALPELSLTAKTGFPYTRLHDLSETTIIVAPNTSAAATQLLLRLTAEFARSTGSATTQVTVTTLDEFDPNQVHDVILIGPEVLADWRRRYGDENLQRELSAQPLAGRELLFNNPQRYFDNSGPSAAIVAFASPFHPERTITAYTATSDAFLARINEVLGSAQNADKVAGFLTVMTPVQIDSFPARQQYYVGELSGFTYYAYHLSKYPLLVVFVALLLLGVAAVLLRQVFGAIARQRQLGRKTK